MQEQETFNAFVSRCFDEADGRWEAAWAKARKLLKSDRRRFNAFAWYLIESAMRQAVRNKTFWQRWQVWHSVDSPGASGDGDGSLPKGVSGESMQDPVMVDYMRGPVMVDLRLSYRLRGGKPLGEAVPAEIDAEGDYCESKESIYGAKRIWFRLLRDMMVDGEATVNEQLSADQVWAAMLQAQGKDGGAIDELQSRKSLPRLETKESGANPPVKPKRELPRKRGRPRKERAMTVK